MRILYPFLTSLIAISLLNSCKKDTLLDQSQDSDQRVILQTDPHALKARVNHSNVGLVNLSGATSSLGFRAGLRTASTQQGFQEPEFSLALIAELAPPTIDGKLLRATHVTVAGNYAYISYNKEGDLYLGGIDVIDISDVNNPKLKVNATVPHVDISSIVVDESNLLFAGAANIDKIQDLPYPAFTGSFPLQGGLLNTNNYQFTSLPGQVGTDLSVDATHAFVVTGDNGVLAKINKSTGTVVKQVSIPGLLSVKHNELHVIALSADNGLLVFDKELNMVKDIVTSKNDSEAKRTIELYEDHILAAEGQEGLGIYDFNTGALRQRIPVPSIGQDHGMSPEDLATIAVSINGDRMFVANGGAGVAAYKFAENKTVNFLGNANLTTIGEGSNNYVLSKGQHVYVASGKGGLKILKMIELKPEQPGVGECDDTYPPFTGNTQQDLNINSNPESYADSKEFAKSINVNRNFTWCGALKVNGNIAVNSGTTFDMSGSLMLVGQFNINSNTNLTGSTMVGGKLAINGGATLTVNGTLAQGQHGQASQFDVNGKMIVDGEVIIYGNLTINGGATVEFANSNSRIVVYGKLTKWGNVIGGTITEI